MNERDTMITAVPERPIVAKLCDHRPKTRAARQVPPAGRPPPESFLSGEIGGRRDSNPRPEIAELRGSRPGERVVKTAMLPSRRLVTQDKASRSNSIAKRKPPVEFFRRLDRQCRQSLGIGTTPRANKELPISTSACCSSVQALAQAPASNAVSPCSGSLPTHSPSLRKEGSSTLYLRSSSLPIA